MKKHKVSVVTCNSYKNKEVEAALKRALKDIDFKFKKNQKILLKPNLLQPATPEKAITTHPVIVEELCKILKKYNAEIYIADSSATETSKTFRVSGLQALEKYGKIINFESQEKYFVDLPSVRKVPLPKLIKEVDLIINLPKLKTHLLTGTTLCVKNLYGCIPGRAKGTYHKVFKYPKKFSQFLLELASVIKPNLNIIDGVLGLEGNGPGTAGTPIKSKVIITGENALATDLIGSEIMGVKSYTNKLSDMKRKNIEVLGELKNLNFKKSSIPVGLSFFYLINSLFPREKITFNHEKCIKCKKCGKNCPVKAISFPDYPKCNHKDCIKCMCCIEICPENAISLEAHWTKKAIKKIHRRIIYRK